MWDSDHGAGKSVKRRRFNIITQLSHGKEGNGITV